MADQAVAPKIVATKAVRKGRLCETCNSTKHYTALCNKAMQTRAFVTSLVTGEWHTFYCVVDTLDRVQLKALLTAILAHLKEMGGVMEQPSKPISKMTNAQLARVCVYGYRRIQETAHENALANADTCSICMENLGKNDAKCTIGCGHSFHTKCYSKMVLHDCLRTNRTTVCPLCRRDAY